MQRKGLVSMTGGILTEPIITVRTVERMGPRTLDMTSPSRSTDESMSFNVCTRHGFASLIAGLLPPSPPPKQLICRWKLAFTQSRGYTPDRINVRTYENSNGWLSITGCVHRSVAWDESVSRTNKYS